MDKLRMTTPKKIAVYTAITAGYDNLEEPTCASPENIDYLAFTDCDINSRFWKIIRLDESYSHLDSVRKARKIKIVGHPALEQYDCTVWIDGNIDIIGDITELLPLLDEHDLITFKHPRRDCVYEEAMSCLSSKRDSVDILKEHIEFLKRQGYPAKHGLIESNVLLRKKTPALEKPMNAWWEMVLGRSRRDQLSFNYIAHQHNLNFGLMGNDNAYDGTSKYFFRRERHRHPPPVERYSWHYRYSAYLVLFHTRRYVSRVRKKLIKHLDSLAHIRPKDA